MIKDIMNAGTSATSSDSNSISFSTKLDQPSQTIGGLGEEKPKFISLSSNVEFMQDAFSVISRVENEKMAKTGKNILDKIINIISQKKDAPDRYNIPKLRGAITEDGAFLIEWATEKFRAGISIEPDERDSGWYLVTAKDLGDINSSGSLFQADENAIIDYLLTYVINHT